MDLPGARYAVTPPDSATGAPPAPGKALRILLVEDHEDTRRAMERLLKRWGYSVQCMGNVAGAVEFAAANEFDVLLTDLGLPDGSGVELLGKLRGGRSFHAIAMSGYGLETDLKATEQAGFEEHLIKPVAIDRLKEILEPFDHH